MVAKAIRPRSILFFPSRFFFLLSLSFFPFFFHSFRITPTFYADYIREVGLINIARQVDEIRVNRWNVAL